MTAAIQERRRLKRYGKLIPALFLAGHIKGKGLIKNLCKEGIFMQTRRLPAPGAEIRILINPEDGRKIEIEGTVRWTTDQLQDRVATPGFGMLIHPVSADYLEFFQDLLLN